MKPENTQNQLGATINKLSAQYIGKPYIADPLNDTDRRFRDDGFDCLTFVETILAYIQPESEKNIISVMDKIRYHQGEANFFKRHHICEQSWIPYNEQAGFVKDVTQRYAEKMHFPTQIASSFADLFGFFTKTAFDKIQVNFQVSSLEEWQKQKDTLPAHMIGEEVNCPYIAISDILENPDSLKQLDTGLILWIIRLNWPVKEGCGTDLLISHVGFVIKKPDDSVYFRHATSTESKAVVEVPLYEYLAQYKDPSKTSVRGIRLVEVQEPRTTEIPE